MKVVALVQSRMLSTRLRGKALKAIAGKPLLQHVLERAMAIRGLHGVALATSTNDANTPLLDVARKVGVDYYRGDESDVLGRFMAIAKAIDADAVMRLTGDCPLLAPEVCERVLDEFLIGRASFVSNDTTRTGYPDGTDCEVFTVELLQVADRRARHHLDREHVTRWMRRHGRPEVVDTDGKHYANAKLSVDSEDDLAYVRRLFKTGEIVDHSLASTMRAVARVGVGHE